MKAKIRLSFGLGIFWFLLGIATVIVAFAIAGWVGSSQQRLCIQEHGSWDNNTDNCKFKEFRL